MALRRYGRRETMLGAEEAVLQELVACCQYGRKPFVQIKPSAGLSETAMVSTWDMLARQGK